MRELYEFRVLEELAHLLFEPGEGSKLGSGSVRRVKLDADDPKLRQVGKLQRTLCSEGRLFFAGWTITRSYSAAEIASASAFQMVCQKWVPTSGEECGTSFDESSTCPHCGVGAVQTSDLILDFGEIPRNADVARTLANEWIVSQRFADLIVDHGLSGVRFRPVHHRALPSDDPLQFSTVPSGRLLLEKASEQGIPHGTWRFTVWLNRPEQSELSDRAWVEHRALVVTRQAARPRRLPTWYQLVADAALATISATTRSGDGPFDLDADGRHRCPLGHVAGLNLLSELFIEGRTVPGQDLAFTEQSFGTRRGLLRPFSPIVVAPRVRALMLDHGIKGVGFEIARSVG